MLAKSACKLIYYFDLCKYDETPVRVTSKQKLSEFLEVERESLATSAWTMGSEHGSLAQSSLQVKAASTSKFSSTETCFAMLFQGPSNPDTGELAVISV